MGTQGEGRVGVLASMAMGEMPWDLGMRWIGGGWGEAPGGGEY